MSVKIEIEKKFIVDVIPAEVKKIKGSVVQQGYICLTKNREVRCRQINEKFYLTIKSDGNLTREETEVELNENQFRAIWDTTESVRIYKERCKINFGKHIIELDTFKGNLSGLLLAEVEFDSIEDADGFANPDWFGKEVTNDKRYKNKNLAVNGLPKI